MTKLIENNCNENPHNEAISALDILNNEIANAEEAKSNSLESNNLLNKIKVVSGDSKLRVLLYGSVGVGKTTLASSFPDAVFIQTENSIPINIQINSFGYLKTYASVIDAMTALLNNEHQFKTIVIDSITSLQRIIFQDVLDTNNKVCMADFKYGRGHQLAVPYWERIIRGLQLLQDDKGMDIVLVGHSITERFEECDGGNYDKYSIDIHKNALPIIEIFCNSIFFMQRELENRDTGELPYIAIHTMPNKGMVAKNRFNMPPVIHWYSDDDGYDTLLNYFPQSLKKT